MASLQEFRVIYGKLLAQEKAKCNKHEHDLAAFQVFRERLCVEFDDRRYVGGVPGVHVGDVFDSDAELFLVGLHRKLQSRVDYINRNGGTTCLAVSIVSYAQQSVQNNNLDFLLHVGSVAATTGQKMEDISAGLEKIPISAINSISNEAPAPFFYISHIQYLGKYQLDPPSGCDCVGPCSDSQKCACVMKNGGKTPFRKTGGLLEEKPLIYECGPSCKCPPTCRNRVGQHGIAFRLQVFKTASMGWGVRSLDFIPTGRFVCEYIGELLDNEDAQERDNDEYLFLIGNNYYDVSRWDNLQKTIPSLRNGPGEEEENFFAVDALKCGNLARFINHSCTPNLFTQNVLYDHDNKGMPHIMLFACEDIQPLEPLSYDYNYTIDGVHDSEGNIKKKRCLCGSVECTGWLY
ncbi:histone-lysine N-methyltransferase, H3 lysine-9 specific SUVH5-like [Aegilops tauschii subsp. strangulata]|uniref:histone-lysine N-methyltransferase, H3 lysine-9 specific SUVH5-like n=1 Tax=Aegilops tauschii subsp. strangulata TaxID=200361 RepID=UPI00098B6E05|nr:histone-lysine N-methyltransferase, H3 lysine-9 specific SUVH5-like [Aegilops tauschii subsp. strangulata]